MTLLTLIGARRDYSGTITGTQVDTGTVRVDHDILVNGVRAGGVSVTVLFQPDGQKQAGYAVASNVGDASHLDQHVDLLYGGVTVGTLTVSVWPDAQIGQAPSVSTAWSQPVPASVETQILL